MRAHVSECAQASRGSWWRWLRGILCLVGWQWRRGFGARRPGAVQALLPFIACRAKLVERGAVGRRLGREDKGFRMRTATLVAGTNHWPVENEVSGVL